MDQRSPSEADVFPGLCAPELPGDVEHELQPTEDRDREREHGRKDNDDREKRRDRLNEREKSRDAMDSGRDLNSGNKKSK